MEGETTRSAFGKLERSLKERDSDFIIHYCKVTQQDLQQAWDDSNSEFTKSILRYITALMQRIQRVVYVEDDFHRALFDLGSLKGTIDVYDAMSYQRQRTQSIISHFEQQKVKHLPEVVRALETHGSMSHMELSRYLDMNSSTLSESMKKILPTGVVSVAFIGKFKMYSLTDVGQAYGKEIRKHLAQGTTLNEICLQLENLLTQARTETEQAIIRNTIHVCLKDADSGALRNGDIFRVYASDSRVLSKRLKVDDITNIIGLPETILGVHEVSDSAIETSGPNNYSDLLDKQIYDEKILKPIGKYTEVA